MPRDRKGLLVPTQNSFKNGAVTSDAEATLCVSRNRPRSADNEVGPAQDLPEPFSPPASHQKNREAGPLGLSVSHSLISSAVRLAGQNAIVGIKCRADSNSPWGLRPGVFEIFPICRAPVFRRPVFAFRQFHHRRVRYSKSLAPGASPRPRTARTPQPDASFCLLQVKFPLVKAVRGLLVFSILS